MSNQELAEKIRDGSYFDDAKSWYAEVYLSLISERVFYIILTGIAVFTSLVALVALIGLLPITPTVPFIIRSQDVAHELPLISMISQDRAQDPNEALRQFMVKRYVSYREEYSQDRITARARVIYRWSTPEAYEVYRRYIDTNNPRSPIIQYETTSSREIAIQSMDIQPDPVGGKNAFIAKIDFVAYVISSSKIETSQWTSEVGFVYKDTEVDQENVDAKTGRMKVTPMEFSVTSYNIREHKSEIGQ